MTAEPAATEDYRPVIVGMDGSRDATEALARAVPLAQAMKVGVVVVHVRHASALAQLSSVTGAQIPELLEQAEAETRAIAERLLGDSRLRWTFEVRDGAPAEELIAAAREHDARGIVVGSRGHGAVASVVLGSVSSALVRRAPQSVLVVRPPLDESETAR